VPGTGFFDDGQDDGVGRRIGIVLHDVTPPVDELGYVPLSTTGAHYV
jgi:hypothetical protein